MQVERRVVTQEIEFRASDGGKLGVLAAYAALFDRYSENLGGFVEQVASSAFAKAVQENDVRCLFNHDPSLVLGRNRSGTLRLSNDETGLHYEVDLPDTAAARDLATLVERGDISGSSFGFVAVDDDWDETEQGMPLRTLRSVKLFDVSPVTYPAYQATQDADVALAVRSLIGRDDVLARRVLESIPSLRSEDTNKVSGEDKSTGKGQEQHSTPSVDVLRARLALKGAQPRGR